MKENGRKKSNTHRAEISIERSEGSHHPATRRRSGIAARQSQHRGAETIEEEAP